MTQTVNILVFSKFITEGLGFNVYLDNKDSAKEVYFKTLDDGRLYFVEYSPSKNVFRGGHIGKPNNYKSIKFLAWQEFNSSVIMVDGILMEGFVYQDEVWKLEDYFVGVTYYDESNRPDYFYKIINGSNQEKNVSMLCDEEIHQKDIGIHRPKGYMFHQQPINLKSISFIFSSVKQAFIPITIVETSANGTMQSTPYFPNKFISKTNPDQLKIEMPLTMIMSYGVKINTNLLPKQSIELTLNW